jgi:hypothetical protein
MKLYQYALITLLLSGCGVYPPYYAWQQEWEGKSRISKSRLQQTSRSSGSESERRSRSFSSSSRN